MSDEEIRRHYEFILTSTELYPPELHRAMRNIIADMPADADWSKKAKQVYTLFSGYGNREYQGEVLYRTVLHGEDGISMHFGDGYTFLPWLAVVNIVNAMIENGEYPAKPENVQPSVSSEILEDTKESLEESGYMVSDDYLSDVVSDLEADGETNPTVEQITEQTVQNLMDDAEALTDKDFDEVLDVVEASDDPVILTQIEDDPRFYEINTLVPKSVEGGEVIAMQDDIRKIRKRKNR